MNSIVNALKTNEKKFEQKAEEHLNKFKRTLFFGDIHFPFHDNKALNLLLQFSEYFQPDEIVIEGDVLDCYPVSKFHKKPINNHDFKCEVDCFLNFIDDLCETIDVNTTIKYMMGNHEEWYTRFLDENPHLITLDEYKLERLLQFDVYNIDLIPYEEKYLVNKNFMAFHGDARQGGKLSPEAGYSAKNTYAALQINGIMGHTHRSAVYYKTTFNGINMFIENGCLCNLTPKTYTHNPNWQHSIAFGFFEPKKFMAYQIPFIDDFFIYDGTMFKTDKKLKKY